jgi:hypothetical protein
MGVQQYLKAAMPEPYIVLGVPLRPFCLGHILLMKRFDCRFGDDAEGFRGIEDLLLGIAICSRSYEDFQEFIYNPVEFESWVSKWGQVVERLSTEELDFNMFEKFMLFKRYMNEGTQIPAFFSSGDNGNPPTVHWTQSLLQALVAEMKFKESEALNMPLGKALQYYCQWLEKNGAIELMNEEAIEPFMFQDPTETKEDVSDVVKRLERYARS